MKHKFCYLATLLILVLLQFANPASGARKGKADLILQQISPGNLVSEGDTLTIGLWIDAHGEPITGVVVYLTLDETCLEIIPAQQTPFSARPFRQGDWLSGTVFSNETLGDKLNDSMANNLPGFQLLYFEDIPPSGFGGPRRTAGGKGLLTEFRVRLLRSHDDPVQAIRVDHISPTGSETGYFHIDNPGVVYSLNATYSTNPAGDFNGDNKRDFHDFILFVQRYGQLSSNSNFSAIYDLNGNNEIDFTDFLLFAQVFGQ